jgi:hypothetical protein
MARAIFQDVKGFLRQLYVEGKRPWLVGFRSGYSFTYVPGRQGMLGLDTYSAHADPMTLGVTEVARRSSG